MRSIVAAGLFALSSSALASAAAPWPIFKGLFGAPPPDPVCIPAPPSLRIMRIDADTLAKVVQPFMPPFVNGVANSTGIRPKNLKLGRFPKTIYFEDPHIKLFQQIAPRSARMFIRQEMQNETRQELPYCSIGKLYVNDYAVPRFGQCTGTVVAENIMVTANHCVPPSRNRTMEFVPAFDAEDATPRPFRSTFVTDCLLGANPEVVDGRDYAVCLLREPIGETVGAMPWMAPRPEEEDGFFRGNLWTSVGYPYNFKWGGVPVIDENVEIEKIYDSGNGGKLLASPPYVDEGWSGGPLFGWVGEDPFIIGVVSNTVSTTLYDGIFADWTQHAAGVRLGRMIEFVRKGCLSLTPPAICLNAGVRMEP